MASSHLLYDIRIEHQTSLTTLGNKLTFEHNDYRVGETDETFVITINILLQSHSGKKRKKLFKEEVLELNSPYQRWWSQLTLFISILTTLRRKIQPVKVILIVNR